MEHSNIIKIHHPSGMLYEAFCQFTKEHAHASFFQSDDLFRMVCQQNHAEATLLLAVARTPALERTQAPGAAGKKAEHAEEESLFPGGALLFRGQPIRDPSADLCPDPDPDLGPELGHYSSGDPGADPNADLGPDLGPGANAGLGADPGADHAPDPDPDPQASNNQGPTANRQHPTPNSQQPTANRQHPTPNSQPTTDIPGVGRVVGSLLAITFSSKTGWTRRMWRQTVVFGGPLLAGGTRLDQETRLRNLLNALDRQVGRRSLSVHIFGFRFWGKLSPIFSELGYSDGGELNALSAWKFVWNAAMEASEATLPPPQSPEVDLARLEQKLETCCSRHGALHKTAHPILYFFLKRQTPNR